MNTLLHPYPAQFESAAYGAGRALGIPKRMMPGLLRWVQLGVRPGSFLSAVIANDLRRAVAHADDENINLLPAYVKWLHNYAPSVCWGSPKALKDWKGF